jgi:hypothetical protein
MLHHIVSSPKITSSDPSCEFIQLAIQFEQNSKKEFLFNLVHFTRGESFPTDFSETLLRSLINWTILVWY